MQGTIHQVQLKWVEVAQCRTVEMYISCPFQENLHRNSWWIVSHGQIGHSLLSSTTDLFCLTLRVGFFCLLGSRKAILKKKAFKRYFCKNTKLKKPTMLKKHGWQAISELQIQPYPIQGYSGPFFKKRQKLNQLAINDSTS